MKMVGDRDADEAEPAGVVVQLREVLGSRLVALIAGVDNTGIVSGWADGNEQPSQQVQDRLEAARDAVKLLVLRDTAPVIQAWFLGRNPILGDESPAYILVSGVDDTSRRRVIDAAQSHIS